MGQRLPSATDQAAADRRTVEAEALWHLGRAIVICALAGLAAAVDSRGATVREPAPAERFSTAQEAYERGHYRSAFDAFAALADQGDCECARIAAQMARWGQPLYAQRLDLDADRLRHWQTRPGCSTTSPGSTPERP
jgi:hypothetical protein